MRKEASKSSNSETLRHRVLPAVAEASSAHDHAVILFDGTCAFCEGAVKFIARRDPAGYFKYSASQSPTAAALLAQYGIGRETARSIVLIEAGQVYLRSTASPTDCESPAISVESRWRVAGRPTPTARRGLPSRRGRTPAAGRFIKCVRGAPARDPPAAHVGVVARIVTGPDDATRQDPHWPMRYDTGRPSSVIRLRISQPKTTSLPCPAGLRARRPSPMMDV